MMKTRSSESTRFWTRLGTRTTFALIGALAFSGALALTGIPFEGLDGNLTVEGSSDWATFAGTADLSIGIDLPTGQADDSFQGKEDDPAPSITYGSIPNNKSDLLRFYVVHETVDVGGADEDVLYVSWVRANTLGSANMDFEFNQSDQLSANGVTPERSPGDMLVTFAFANGGNQANLGLSTWTEVGPCEASNSAPCWGPIMALTGIAEGSVNDGEVTDPIAGVTLADKTFGEAVVNLTQAGVFDRDTCTTFGSAHVTSRSSDSFTSSMKDFISPIDVSVSNCATITVRKNAVPDDEQDFTFAPSSELHPADFVLDDDGDDSNGLADSATFQVPLEAPVVVSELPTEGWDLTAVECDGPATPERDASDRLTGRVDIDATGGETVTCTFTNTKRGRLVVEQRTDPDGDPQSFDFTASGGPAGLDASFALSSLSAPWDAGAVPPGVYSLTQLDDGPLWDLASASCDDGSPVTAVAVDPGETVTCTFLNVKRGAVVVDEVTLPAGDPQSFDFALAGGPDAVNQAFALTDVATPHTSGPVRSGSYDVTQTLPAGWDLTSAVCDDGSPVDDVLVAPGETVVCTFTNTKRGTILVDQVTIPAGDPQSFEFDLTGGPDGIAQSFALTDAAAPHDSGTQQPGSYDVTQTLPAGWDLTSATCSDGSTPAAVALDPGETVTCTFTNTKRGSIVVDEVTLPAGDTQSFDFDLTGGPDGIAQAFALTDGSSPHDSGAQRPGVYAVSQELPAGWDLTSAVCSDGSSPGAVDLGPGERVTCTFTNTKRGSIVVDEVTLPAGDPQSFDFGLGGGPDGIAQNFGLTDAAAPHDSGAIRPGTYAATQTLPDGWDLTSATCSDGSDPGAVNLGPGETVTCTFTNTKRGSIVVDQITLPSDDPQAFEFDLTGGPDAVSQAFALTDAAAPRESGLLRPGTFAVAQTLPAGWDLADASCSDGSDPASVGLDPGETVLCTFTNVKRGRIAVDVVTDPKSDPQVFDFDLGGGPDSVAQSFGLADDSTPHDSGLLRPGSYSVVAGNPGELWTAAGAVCSDGSDPSDLTLDPGEEVLCTFSFIKLARLTVVHDSVPDDPQDFAFSLSGVDYLDRALDGAWSLDDDGDPAVDLPDTHSMLLPHGAFAVVEGDPGPAWDPTSISCSSDSGESQASTELATRTAQLTLSAGEHVTCVFVDTKRGRIVVEKQVENESLGSGFDPRDYPFTFSPSWGDDFELKHGERHESEWLATDRGYSVSESKPNGWEAESVCVYPDGSTSSGGTSIGVDLEPGAEVHCTFYNVMRLHPGSSGFWKNWRNHYGDDQLRAILSELYGLRVYAGLFDENGTLIPEAVSIIDDLYQPGNDSLNDRVLFELTTLRLNLIVSKSEDPAIRALQKNDDICLDCELDVSDTVGAADLLGTWADCWSPDETVVADVVDVTEATWVGDITSRVQGFSGLNPFQKGLLFDLLEDINHGRNVVVDPRTYPDDPGCLVIENRTREPRTWYADADGDGFGDPAQTTETCSTLPPDGFVAVDGDCNDGSASAFPGAQETCDGLDNDCDGTSDAGLDGDVDGVDDLCDAYPADATRSGPLHVGMADAFDDLWTPVTLPTAYQDPVIIVGPPSYNDDAPGVAQLDVAPGTQDAFMIRFAEWMYQDGIHGAESVPFLAMERGRYVMDDGSVWEWGRFPLDSALPRFKARSFEGGPFAGAPALFLSAQTDGGQPVALRARNVGAAGFEVALFQEEALLDAPVSLEVGYLAIYSPGGSGSISLGDAAAPYLLQRPSVDHSFTPVLAWSVRLEEEQSKDAELAHGVTSLDTLALGGHLFAQDVASAGWDTVGLRRRDPEPGVAMEWGVVRGVDDTLRTVPLFNDYADPVVIVKPVSDDGGLPGVIRLRDVAADSFALRFSQWSYLGCCGGGDTVFYMVADVGLHSIAGLDVEAGHAVLTGTMDVGGWTPISFTTAFPAAPAVFASVQTTSTRAPVTSRVSALGAAGFSVAMQEEEAADQIHAAETLGWIAVETGAAITPAGHRIDVMLTRLDDAPTMVGSGRATAGAIPVVLADIVSADEPDACVLRHKSVTPDGIELFIEEEQSLDDEMTHGMEDVSVFFVD
jgi:hypothetical protein